MADAKTWLVILRTMTPIFALCAALTGIGAILLDRSVQWGRRLSPSQIESLTELLTIAPKLERAVTIARPQGDDEAKDVGDQVKLAFERAAFTVDGVWPDSIIGSDPIGVLVRQKPTDAPTGAQVAAALNSVGLASRIVEYGDLGSLDIYIGRKP